MDELRGSKATISKRKGPLVARKRPTASDDALTRQRPPDRRTVRDVLTPAQAHAWSRSAPLTPAEFKAKRRAAEQRADPLPILLERDGFAPAPGEHGSPPR